MAEVLIISAVTFALMICAVVFLPSIKIKRINISTYWIVTLLGALLLLCRGFLGWEEAFYGMTGNTGVNPLKIIVLFLSMTLLSIYLDEVGFFRYIAYLTLSRAKTSQKRLFIYLCSVVSVLTVFTSNDIIVLTFTPFICYFAKAAKINPMPYLIAEFVCANTWSMALVIGNPTNIYLATAFQINFLQYLKIMILPTVLGGTAAVTVLYLLFRKELKKPFENSAEKVNPPERAPLFIGLLHLSVCTVLLIISSYVNIEMWLISLCSAVSLFAISLIYRAVKKQRPSEEGAALKRAPYELIPFVLSMFVFVLTLDKIGATAKLAEFLGAGSLTALSYGGASALFCNFINNIPMSVLFCSVLSRLPENVLMQGVFATIAGSNIGAFLTPIGALAGIMWSNILKKNEVRFSYISFIRYGILIGMPTLLATLGGLYAVFAML